MCVLVGRTSKFVLIVSVNKNKENIYIILKNYTIILVYVSFAKLQMCKLVRYYGSKIIIVYKLVAVVLQYAFLRRDIQYLSGCLHFPTYIANILYRFACTQHSWKFDCHYHTCPTVWPIWFFPKFTY